MLLHKNRNEKRREELINEASEHGSARYLCQWFDAYPDLDTLAYTDSDQDILRAIMWRFVTREIFVNLEEYYLYKRLGKWDVRDISCRYGPPPMDMRY